MDKIGVTEQGDAALDLSWVDKLGTVAGAVVITKGLYEPFKEQLLANRDKLMLHLTCTGYGGTVLEPNVPGLSDTLMSLDDLMHRGFPSERIVVRVDPIIPTGKGIGTAKKVIDAMYRLGIRRIRVSVLDMYKHVQTRFQAAGLPLPYGNYWQASKQQFFDVDRIQKNIEHAFTHAATAETLTFASDPNGNRVSPRIIPGVKRDMYGRSTA